MSNELKVVAWADEATRDVINDERRSAWQQNFGFSGQTKAATYTLPLVTLASANARIEALEAALSRVCAHGMRTSAQIEADWDAARKVLQQQKEQP